MKKFKRKVSGVLLVFFFLFTGLQPFALQVVSAAGTSTDVSVPGWTDTGSGWKVAVVNSGDASYDVSTSNANYSGDTLTLSATGGSFYKKVADSSLFSYVPVSGDFSITARVKSPSANTTNLANADAMLMVRAGIESTAAEYSYWFAPVATSGTRIRASVRTAVTKQSGGIGTELKTGFSEPAVYMKLQRAFGKITTSYSTDGVTWTEQHSDYDASFFPNNVLVGIAVQDLKASFDQIEVVQRTTIAPDKPTGLKATAGYKEATITWPSLNYASSYSLKRSETLGGSYTTVVDSVYTTSYTDTGLTNGTKYYYVLSGINSFAEGVDSDPVEVTPVLATPTGLNFSDGYLKWDTVAGATYYTVKDSTNVEGPFDTVATNLTITQFVYGNILTNRTLYFAVTASDRTSESLSSEVISISPAGMDGVSPVITMTSAPATVVYKDTLLLSGSVSEACYLTISNNQSLIKLDGDKTKLSLSADGTFSNTLTLTEGINKIVITATDERGNTATNNYTVNCTKIRVEDFVGIDIGSPAAGSLSFDDDYNLFKATGAGTGITKNMNPDQIYLIGTKVTGDYSLSGKMNFKYIEGTNINYTTVGVTIRQSGDPVSLHVSLGDQYGGKPVVRRMTRILDSTTGLVSPGAGNLAYIPANEGGYFKVIKIGNSVTEVFSFNPIPDDLSTMEYTRTLKDGTTQTISQLINVTATGLGLDANGDALEDYAGFFISSVSPTLLMPVTFEDIKIVMTDGTVAFDSNEGKPVPPRNVVTKPYSDSAQISWDALSTATSYTVKQSTSADGPFTAVQTLTGSTYSTMVNGLENDKTYYYVVTANNASGESITSKVVRVTPGAWVLVPPVITMTSAQPASEVFSALLPLSGSVDKASTLTIKNNGNLVKLDEDSNTSLSLAKNGAFNKTLILDQGINRIEIKVLDDYGFETTVNYTVTYTNKVGNISFSDAEGNVITTLTQAEDIVVKADVENYIDMDSAKDYVLVVGLYDPTNTLVKFVYSADTVAYGESEVFYAKIKLPGDVSGYTIKAYVWNNFVNMHPISEVAVLK